MECISETISSTQAIGLPTAPDSVPSWHFLSHIVIRRTGFPIEWLEQLATPASAALAAELATQLDEIASIGQTLLKQTFPQAVMAASQANDRMLLRILSRLRHKVGHQTLSLAALDQLQTVLPVSIKSALTELCERRTQLEGLYRRAEELLEDELQRSRARLRQIAVDPFFQEAIFVSNPDLYKNSLQPFLAHPDRPIDVTFERKLVAYLQRFCAKNDTVSFFGPLNCGRIVPDQDESIRIETAGAKFTSREVFVGFWVANRLAEIISADPGIKGLLAPRIHPQCLWQGDTVVFPARERRARLNRLQQAIMARVDGVASSGAIATAIDSPIDEVCAEISRLVAARVLICRLEIPSTIFHPFTYLMRLIEQLPPAWERRAYWIDRLSQFDALRRQFIDADLPNRQRLLSEMDALYTSLTDEAPRRSAGATYADRILIYEDCAGTFETFHFNKQFFDDFQRRLSPILDLCAAHGSLLKQHYQTVGRTAFDILSPDGAPVPYARFITAVQQQQQAGQFPHTSAALEQLSTSFRGLVEQRSDGHVARLTGGDLVDLLAGIPIERNSHSSPDVMFAAPSLDHLRRGEYQVVLGEMHQVMYVWGSQLYFYPQHEAAESEMVAHLERMPDYAGLATILNERQHKGLLYEAFPGTIIEVSALPSARASARIPLAMLDVALAEGELALYDRRNGQRLRLYTAGDEQLHLWALAVPRVCPIPVQLGGHTPRIEINGCVYQRERWQLPAAEWGAELAQCGPLDLLTRTQRIVQQHTMPRYVFGHVRSEPKPYYIDFSNTACLRILQQVLLLNQQVTFSEMLPGLDQLWLAEQDGHFCCEFRMTACRY